MTHLRERRDSELVRDVYVFMGAVVVQDDSAHAPLGAQPLIYTKLNHAARSVCNSPGCDGCGCALLSQRHWHNTLQTIEYAMVTNHTDI